ncbi:MAG: imidazole glycerol phosphate synthase subunit HisH [Bacteroides sp.]|nr:imidazole glycerol phosphate synthase subunit HisH [Bacteroides sp.]
MNIVIIKYNAGNIYSVDNALKRLGLEPEITADSEKILAADKVIFPGQGEASSTMQYLREHKMDRLIKELKQPVFGICIGMQLMCRYSEENQTECLSIFDTEVKQFIPERHEDKVPHMGWNAIYDTKSELFKGFSKEEFVYFVHSYYVPVNPFTAATSDYILPFSAALQRDNFFATQFHPEKSGTVGERILRNFLELKP